MIYEIALIAGSAIGFSWAGPPVVKKLRQVKLPSVKRLAKVDELFPGVVKPSVLAIDLVCSRILRGEWAKCHTYDRKWNERYRQYENWNAWTDGVVSIKWEVKASGIRSFSYIKIADKDLPLNHQGDKLDKAIEVALKLHQDKEAAAKAAEIEQTACDAIEILMGLEKKEEKCESGTQEQIMVTDQSALASTSRKNASANSKSVTRKVTEAKAEAGSKFLTAL